MFCEAVHVSSLLGWFMAFSLLFLAMVLTVAVQSSATPHPHYNALGGDDC